jgi:translation initiation factor 3 subunit A
LYCFKITELIAIGEKKDALKLLHTILTAKRHRTWQKIHETIIMKYMDICVELQLSRDAKDGLHQYRNISQQQAPNSLEVAIQHLIKLAEGKARKAKAASGAASMKAAANVDDLEAEQSPESIMLSTMTAEGDSDRLDREVVVPWLKFLWETYRTILEILRNNSKLESVYHGTCKKAFKFCLEYKRNTEFRRLCEILRNHLINLQKHAANVAAGTNTRPLRGWDGWTPESIELHLQTRFSQLEAATTLELWNEGFRTVEDIHQIMQMTNKPPKAQLMATYYDKLTQIFWVSQNYLFHGFAWWKSYNLYEKHHKGMTAEEKRSKASSVLLAALSIPINSSKSEGAVSGMDYDMDKEKNQRMATLLGFNMTARRDTLLAEITNKGILNKCMPEIAKLYDYLEKDFHPLKMVSLVTPILDILRENEELKQYVTSLEKLLVLRLLNQLASIYQNVRIDHLNSLLDGISLQFADVEKLLVQTAQSQSLKIRIDHQNKCLCFGEAVLETESTRNQLTELAKRLNGVTKSIKSGAQKVLDVQFEKDKATLFPMVAEEMAAEHMANLERKGIIEKRKELLERMEQEKARDEQRKKDAAEVERKAEEQARLVEERKEREKKNLIRKQKEQKLAELKSNATKLGLNADEIDIETFKDIDEKKIYKEAQTKARKVQMDLQRRQGEQSRRLDHITRAIREEERPMIAKAFEERCTVAEQEFYKSWEQEKKHLKEEHTTGLEEKKRLARMQSHRAEFEVKRDNRRQAAFAVVQMREQLDRMRDKLDRAQETKEDKEEADRRAEIEEERAQEAARALAAAEKKLADQAKMREAETLKREQERAEQGGWDRGDDDDDEPAGKGRGGGFGDRDDRGSRGGGFGDRGGGGGGGFDRDDRGKGGFGMRDERDDRGKGGGFGDRGGGGGGGGGGGDRWERGGGGKGGGDDRGKGGFGMRDERDDRDDRGKGGGFGDRGGGGGGGGGGDRWERGGGGKGGGDDRGKGGFGMRDERDDRGKGGGGGGGGDRWERGGGGKGGGDDRGGGGRFERRDDRGGGDRGGGGGGGGGSGGSWR